MVIPKQVGSHFEKLLKKKILLKRQITTLNWKSVSFRSSNFIKFQFWHHLPAMIFAFCCDFRLQSPNRRQLSVVGNLHQQALQDYKIVIHGRFFDRHNGNIQLPKTILVLALEYRSNLKYEAIKVMSFPFK